MDSPVPGVPALVAEVAVAAPVRHLLSYAVPDELREELEVGQQVRVPLGPRKVHAYVVSIAEASAASDQVKLREIASIVEARPALTTVTLDLGLWVAQHYGAAPGEAFQTVLPAPVRRRTQPRAEVRVSLVDENAARTLIDQHGEKPAWQARRRVIAALLELEGEGLALGRLLEKAEVSASPVETLVRSGVLAKTKVVEAPMESGRRGPISGPEYELSDDQKSALEVLLPLLRSGQEATALLHGVTGSGKTEVYLQLLEETLKLGRGAVLLVPEIALTPQTVERLSARLPEIAVLHSNLSPGDRAHEWDRLRRGEVRIAIGPRSAVFAPIEDVGLIIIDEEHETTFKQNNVPRYHTRSVARERARLEGCLLVLGSATPSLEAEAACQNGEIVRLSMPSRVEGRPMPGCTVIDMRKEKPVAGGILSRPLFLAIERCLDRGEQALLFLNRRGFATQVLCRRCGWRAACKSCDIHLTHYRQTRRLLCHYCGHEETPPTECPDCAGADLLFQGVGTERVANNAMMLFPDANVARADAETLRPRGAPERLYQGLKDGSIHLLVGTQVVAKGLDIPNISLVGVITADTALLMPDFRSAERTFQVLCQVAGRAGRGQQPGQVLIQTWCPEQSAIQLAARHDSISFAQEELRKRRELGYPPHGHIARVVVESPEEPKALTGAKELGEKLRALPIIRSRQVSLLGPAPCPLTHLRGNWRYHLLLRTDDSAALTELLGELPLRNQGNPRILVDRDPVAML